MHKKDKTIRKIFVPEDDYTLFFMDYEQVEYRIFASYAKATGLIDAIHKGHDVHQATAGIIYNVPYDEVTDEQRTKAKTVNFSILYGAGEAKLASGLTLSLTEARNFKAKYFAQLPEAEPFISQVQRVTKTRGYIKNLYGRRRRLNYNECYKAPNALIQGAAADLMKAKLVVMYKFLKEGNYRTRILLPVHDEVIFEVHNEEHHILPKLKWLMSEYEKFRVPIETDIEMGSPSWGEKTSYEIETEPPSAEELQRIYDYDLFK